MRLTVGMTNSNVHVLFSAYWRGPRPKSRPLKRRLSPMSGAKGAGALGFMRSAWVADPVVRWCRTTVSISVERRIQAGLRTRPEIALPVAFDLADQGFGQRHIAETC